MKRPAHSKGNDGRAALYVLGALEPDQVEAFEQRLRGSPSLRAEVEELRAAATELALAVEPLAPRPEVRETLLARVAAEARPAASARLPELLFAFAREGEWIRVAPGLERRSLVRSRGEGSAYLLRVAPGATIPQHEHRAVEHSYVLSGSIDVDGQLCRAGDYHRAASGTSHRAPHSVDGCVMLVVLEAPPPTT